MWAWEDWRDNVTRLDSTLDSRLSTILSYEHDRTIFGSHPDHAPTRATCTRSFGIVLASDIGHLAAVSFDLIPASQAGHSVLVVYLSISRHCMHACNVMLQLTVVKIYG